MTHSDQIRIIKDVLPSDFDLDFMSEVLEHNDIAHHLINDYIKIGGQYNSFEIRVHTRLMFSDQTLFELVFIENENKYLQEPVAIGTANTIIREYRKISNQIYYSK